MGESINDLKSRMGWEIIQGITRGESLARITQTMFDMVTIWHINRRKEEKQAEEPTP